jgi:hypothetical protein
VGIADEMVLGPLDPATYFPKTLDIPVTNLAVDGKFYLRLKMEPYNGQAARYADPVAVTCDDTRPYGDNKPLAMEIPAAPITDDYLAANAGKVSGGIPYYTDFQPGDKVAFFWTNTPVDEDWSSATPVDEVTLDGTTWPFPVEYLEADLRTKADGEWYLMYGLVDKATNPSLVSFGSRLRMALGPWPTGMLDPKVPLADDGLVDLKDAIAGVNVVVEDFQNHKPTDEIVVTWGARPQPGVPISATPFPRHIPLPNADLIAQYGAATGPVDTVVSYFISRGGVPSASMSTTVSVDFSVVGPGPDPDPWPDPVNDNLPLAEIYGEVSQIKNQLTRADEGKDADVSVELYGPVKAGEVIDFYWNGVFVPSATYTVAVGDSAGDIITRVIPWQFIKDGLNDPALPVHYRISATADPDDNELHSRNTTVNVDAISPVAPPTPKFQGLAPGPGGNEFLNCSSLVSTPPHADDPAVRVEVPALNTPPFNLPDGTRIQMSWRVTKPDGTTPIDSVDFDEEIELGTDYAAAGFVWRIKPYADYIEPIYIEGPQDGRARVTYSFEFEGETVSSGPMPPRQGRDAYRGRGMPDPTTAQETVRYLPWQAGLPLLAMVWMCVMGSSGRLNCSR